LFASSAAFALLVLLNVTQNWPMKPTQFLFVCCNHLQTLQKFLYFPQSKSFDYLKSGHKCVALKYSKSSLAVSIEAELITKIPSVGFLSEQTCFCQILGLN